VLSFFGITISFGLGGLSSPAEVKKGETGSFADHARLPAFLEVEANEV